MLGEDQQSCDDGETYWTFSGQYHYGYAFGSIDARESNGYDTNLSSRAKSYARGYARGYCDYMQGRWDYDEKEYHRIKAELAVWQARQDRLKQSNRS